MPKHKLKHEPWEDELLAMHRWGRFSFWFNIKDKRGNSEHARLKKLWNRACPLSGSAQKLMEQIMALEICNWKLENSVVALCRAIGKKKPADIPIGHMSSMTEERWHKIWAYYLTLRNWLPREIPSGYESLLNFVDRNTTIQNRIVHMLGDRNRLKELYVERFCVCLEFWLAGMAQPTSAWKIAHEAAVSLLDKEIRKIDKKHDVLPEAVLKNEGAGRLSPCSHKLFYRYDLIISSIGAGKWRAVMGRRAIDGFARADLVEKYLSPIESWMHGTATKTKGRESKIAEEIRTSLGKPDDVKIFLASLLVSLLRPQQLAAQKLAQSRAQGIKQRS